MSICKVCGIEKRGTCHAEYERRIAKIKSRLAALEARRCVACHWYEAGIMDPASCGVLQGFVPYNDFWCRDWQAHAEEGSE